MKPYRAAPGDPDHHSFVTRMFDRIAPTYDRLNAIMTLGLDRWWRFQLVASLDSAAYPRVLDTCTGTGDVALALAQRAHHVVGLDAARDMLVRARWKGGRMPIRWCEGNCLRLPFPDCSFDAATMAFGIRNVADRVGALGELARVVRPGGRIVILEVLKPDCALWDAVLTGYQKHIIPLLGAVFAGNRSAYEYLGRSIAGFGAVPEFEEELRLAGLDPEESRRLTGGSAVLFRARRR